MKRVSIYSRCKAAGPAPSIWAAYETRRQDAEADARRAPEGQGPGWSPSRARAQDGHASIPHRGFIRAQPQSARFTQIIEGGRHAADAADSRPHAFKAA